MALVAIAALGLLQIDAGEAVAKKKKLPWWGTFARSGPIVEPRPGYTWDVNYTLRVSKKGPWSINDAVGRLNCWDGNHADGTVTPTSEYFEFAIPPVSGRLFGTKKELKKAKRVSDHPRANGVPIAENMTGQTPTGRGFIVSVYRRNLSFPVRGGWYVEWIINWQCAGGATVGGVRVIPTYAARQ